MKQQTKQYRAEVVIRSPLSFETEYPDSSFLDERIERLKIETKMHGGAPAVCVVFMMIGPKDREKALTLLEVLSNSLVGYLSMIYEEEAELESIYLLDPRTSKMTQQQETRGYKSQRLVGKLARVPVFGKKERMALYWLGKGNVVIRPDDKLSCYYTAAEALISSERRKTELKETCDACQRPFASGPMKSFLTEECSMNTERATAIVNLRGDIVHGRKSSITHYKEFMTGADELMKAITLWFTTNHQTPHYPPALMVGAKFRIEGTAEGTSEY